MRLGRQKEIMESIFGRAAVEIVPEEYIAEDLLDFALADVAVKAENDLKMLRRAVSAVLVGAGGADSSWV